MHDLRAAPLEGRTLAAALADLANDWSAGHALSLRFVASGAERPFPVRVEAGLYRIAQEALANFAHHANAHHVLIELTATPTQVDLALEDDGHGFDVAHLPAGRYGLMGLTERARLLHGSLDGELARRVAPRLPGSR